MRHVLSWPLRLVPLLAVVSAFPETRAQGRGDYFNVESPQVSPLVLTTVGSKTVLLVCNTPLNALEVWDTDEALTPTFSARRIQQLNVGLEPISVHAEGNRFWTTNFLGDSVTAGELTNNNGAVSARVTNTATVGDEPMAIAYYNDNGTPTIFVTLHTASAVAWLDAVTLLPRLTSGATPPLVQAVTPPPAPHGLKEPRGVVVDGGRVFALAFKGGVTPVSGLPSQYSTHDLDILSAAIPSASGSFAFDRSIAGLGSTNFNMRLAGGDLWVVGGEARNFDLDGKPNVRAAASGFVESTLYRVVNPGTTTPTVYRRDVNKLASGSVVNGSTSQLALAMPTDLAVYLPSGAPPKVFVAAMSSDRIGVITQPTGGTADISTWDRSTIAYPASGPVGGNGSTRWGPRGMVLGTAAGNVPRLYVLNRIDNSLSIFNPANNQHVDSTALQDPTPAYIRRGRRYLYSAEFSGVWTPSLGQGGDGLVSCASCHTEGRLDALSWMLGNAAAQPPLENAHPPLSIFHLAGTGSFPTPLSDPWFHVGMVATNKFDPIGPEDKREMVTQSLQGLLNFEAEPVDRDFVTNAPYHWRGDKPSFLDFNEAFETLLGATHVNTAAGGPAGLTDTAMAEFEQFINSISYPPNPQQPKDRTLSPDQGTFKGGASGLQLFFERPTILANRSCAHCHTLPEGSNHRLTVLFGVQGFTANGYVAVANDQALESTAMRGLLQKEPLLEANGNTPDSPGTTPILGHFGMAHAGIEPATAGINPHTSINLFVDLFFLPGFGSSPTSPEARAVKQFAHEMDWGAAPVIGETIYYPAGGTLDPRIIRMVQQADLGNAGVVVWVNTPGATTTERGFRYYPPLQMWLEEPGLAVHDSTYVLSQVAASGDALVALSVPLGSERRIATRPSAGAVSPYLQITPSNVALLSMVPNTAYGAVPGFVNNWIPPNAPASVLGTAAPFNFGKPDNVDEVFAKVVRLFQYGLMGPNYGVPNLRHEASRRLRVTGDGILTGSRLLLSIPWPAANYNGAGPLNDPNMTWLTLEFPIFPTSQFEGGRTVWETAVELSPYIAYQLMLGGPRAPGIQRTIDYVICSEYFNYCGATIPAGGTVPNPAAVIEPTASNPTFTSPFDPANWNWHKVQVRNPGPTGPYDTNGTPSTAVLRQLKM